MAIVNVPAPRRADISPVLNFMLQMSSLRERKETRKLQERQVSVDEAALDISQAKLPSQIGQAEAVAAQMTAQADETAARTKALYSDDAQRLNREAATLTNAGLKAEAKLKRQEVKEARFKIEELERLRDDNPKMFETMVLADNIAKASQAEMRGLSASNDALMQQVRLGQLTLARQAQQFRERVPMYTLAGSFTDPTKQAAAVSALDNNRMDEFTNIAALASEDVKEAKTEKTQVEKEKLVGPITAGTEDDTGTFGKDVFLSPLTQAQHNAAQVQVQTPPEIRVIPRPANVDLRPGITGAFGRGEDFIALNRADAVQRGISEEWDAAGGEGTDKPLPARSKQEAQRQLKSPTSVKQGVKDAVSKTIGTKKPAKKTKQITDSRGWINFVSPDGIDTWVNPKDVELAKTRGYTLGR